jgi:hypothetical protein
MVIDMKNKELKIIYVDKPLGTVKLNWWGKPIKYITRTESCKLNETFQEWWIRKQNFINDRRTSPAYENIKGILLYDVMPVGGILNSDGEILKKESALFVRYAYFK